MECPEGPRGVVLPLDGARYSTAWGACKYKSLAQFNGPGSVSHVMKSAAAVLKSKPGEVWHYHPGLGKRESLVRTESSPRRTCLSSRGTSFLANSKTLTRSPARRIFQAFVLASSIVAWAWASSIVLDQPVPVHHPTRDRMNIFLDATPPELLIYELHSVRVSIGIALGHRVSIGNVLVISERVGLLHDPVGLLVGSLGGPW